MESFLSFSIPLTILISLLAFASNSDAWGKNGHFMVCKIAEMYLNDGAQIAVKELLPEIAKGELASVCSWADNMRFKYHWSSPLHFANTPEVCNFNYSRDCHNPKGLKNMCVVGAIYNYTEQLQSFGHSANAYNLTESLMFLAHFMGDIHQPLHVGYDDDDGGNTIALRWYKRKTNLHSLWDTLMIDTIMKTFYKKDRSKLIEAIEFNITDGWSNEVPYWEACDGKTLVCPQKYASESIILACKYAYKDVEQNVTLGDDYFYSRYPVLEKQIAKAGMRLATVLNGVFGGGVSEIKGMLHKDEKLRQMI